MSALIAVLVVAYVAWFAWKHRAFITRRLHKDRAEPEQLATIPAASRVPPEPVSVPAPRSSSASARAAGQLYGGVVAAMRR